MQTLESSEDVVAKLTKEKEELLLQVALLTAENKLLKWRMAEQD